MTSAERVLSLPADLNSVRTGRLFARDVVTEWDLEGLADDVQLGVSELITNAVRHAGTEVVLTLRLDTALTVEVVDTNPTRAPRTETRAAAVSESSGRGLQIVSAISSNWGVTTGEHTKTVWFRLTLPRKDAADADVFSINSRQHDVDQHAADHDGPRNESAREMQGRAAS
jgi:anti-sigma regulatory factor (Ser/Thr protein kinase)